MFQESIESFREKLDKQYSWPAVYTFKFISTKDKTDEVTKLFPRHEVIEKPSSKGKYISLTIRMMVKSSQEVINVYVEVHKIGGVISL